MVGAELIRARRSATGGSHSSVSFEETATRSDEMNSTIEQWIDDLVAGADDALDGGVGQRLLDAAPLVHLEAGVPLDDRLRLRRRPGSPGQRRLRS